MEMKVVKELIQFRHSSSRFFANINVLEMIESFIFKSGCFSGEKEANRSDAKRCEFLMKIYLKGHNFIGICYDIVNTAETDLIFLATSVTWFYTNLGFPTNED